MLLLDCRVVWYGVVVVVAAAVAAAAAAVVGFVLCYLYAVFSHGTTW